MKFPISITALASVSALGSARNIVWKNYLNNKHYISKKQFEQYEALVAQLPPEEKNKIQQLKESDVKYKGLDNSVLYAIYVARKAVQIANWKPSDNFGINIGSSRGATAIFEKHHEYFLRQQVAQTLSSPTTTLGNISSWLAHDLQTNGPEISHSITCSTGLHAMLNGVAWLLSGMTDKFLVGASEAALTSFTIAQMQALKVYAKEHTGYPCQALNLNKQQNTMVIGEGAAVACLEKGKHENAIAVIEGVGYATEVLAHNVSISAEADCFQKSMKMALGNVRAEEVDVVVMHAPGTKKGDASEMSAVEKVFASHNPFLTTNKWKLGHTFAASGMLSVELAILMLQHQQCIAVPFVKEQIQPKQIRKVMVNAVGFGGNAVSVLLSK